jgi:hypothetical protein
MLLLTGIPTSAQPARVVRIISPEQGEMVAGPDVTFIVEAPGVRLPDEHLHVFVDGAALRYVLGNPVPIGQADFVHFRALKTTIRLPAGPHFVVIVAGDPQHVPFWPLVADSRYFFVR